MKFIIAFIVLYIWSSLTDMVELVNVKYAFDPMTAYIIASGIAGGAQTLSGLFRGKARMKVSPYLEQYLSDLEKQKKEGIYDPGTRRAILGQTTSAGEETAGRIGGEVRGDAIRRGMEKSSLYRNITNPMDRAVIQGTQEASTKLDIENVMSKVEASKEIGRIGENLTGLRTQLTEADRAARRQDVFGGLGTISQAIGQYATHKADLAAAAEDYGQYTSGTIITDANGVQWIIIDGKKVPYNPATG